MKLDCKIILISIKYITNSVKSKKVQDLFSDISTHYDFMNNLISFGQHQVWRLKSLRLSEQIRANNDLKVLDLCCGTGDYCQLLAPRLSAGSQILGVDYSPKMLEIARLRANNYPHKSKITFALEDATSLNSIQDNSFNLCTVGFGLRNVDPLINCLQTIYRVLNTNGELIILDLSKPVNFLMLPFYLAYMHIIVPLSAFILKGHLREYHWLIESLQEYPSYDKLAEDLRNTGFRNVKTIRWFGGVIAIHYGVK